ncbi:MAG: hydantoinase/oxoprolinase family protein [Gammaproteobacteria bacterium]|nr:hydantoinase/oxoprolinase family protein [Gammaproteobacteria bacterium]
MTLLGIDTGGTFTDFILYQEGSLITHKVLSTPKAPELAILQGIKDLGLMDTELTVVHGSTVATNAVLEGKGVSTAYITNHGLGDVLSIGRQTRCELYNLQPNKNAPPITKEYCLETGGRLSATAEVIEPLSQQQLEELVIQLKKLAPQAVAINLLFSYLDDAAEKRIAEIIPANIFVSRSSEVLAEYKEYERGIATWLNSYVGPLVQGYLQRLQGALPNATVAVMQSAGGTIAAELAGQQAVHMLLSGPAGGLAAAKYMGDITSQQRLLTFDMGGTSTDVAMIDGELQLSNEGEIAGYPVAIPMVDMHTIGAGGGSIASIDAGGLLQVGPESAGADPGPACYGKSGQLQDLLATVTDANLMLGRLRPDAFLGGGMSLDIEAARQAIKPIAEKLKLSIEDAAAGIISIANEHMAHALRVMSVQRGIDPRELSLVSFGGAGGLHVCALADALTMQHAMVPRYAGVLSALGMLVAPRARQLSQTFNNLLNKLNNEEIKLRFTKLYQKGISELQQEGVAEKDIVAEYSLDCRYFGQSYFLNVKWLDIGSAVKDFQALHEKRYGHQLELDVELVNLRLSLKSKTEDIQLPLLEKSKTIQKNNVVKLVGIEKDVPVFNRDDLSCGEKLIGPALITETVSTTYLAPGWTCEVDKSACLLLQKVK